MPGTAVHPEENGLLGTDFAPRKSAGNGTGAGRLKNESRENENSEARAVLDRVGRNARAREMLGARERIY